MNVDRNEKIWAYSNTGTRMHAFVQKAENGRLRAMCRKTITRPSDTTFVGRDEAYLICPSCLKKVLEMWDRTEASMQPATEAHDLGYVAPVADEDAEGEAIENWIVGALKQDTQRQMDDLHAEAIEMDEYETAKVELVGKWFKPTAKHPGRGSQIVKVDRVGRSRYEGAPYVAFEIHRVNHNGNLEVFRGSMYIPAFRQSYETL